MAIGAVESTTGLFFDLSLLSEKNRDKIAVNGNVYFVRTTFDLSTNGVVCKMAALKRIE